jgi:hypothetical protein
MDSNEIYIKAEDIELLKDLINRKNKGFTINSKTVIDLYLKVMGKPARPTTCSACLKGYIQQMESKWNRIQKALEKAKEEEAPVEETPKQVEDKPKTKGVAKKNK